MSSLKSLGFHSAAVLNPEKLPENFLQDSDMPEDSSVIIGFFPFENSEETGLISPFAIKNYYKEIIKRMRQSLKDGGPPFSELTKRQLRFFANSRFPEKETAITGGLGFRGRNTLLINPDFGSRGLLGGMIIPMKLEEDVLNTVKSPLISCGTCRLCEEACPGGALSDYKLDRTKCLQHWTTEDGKVPDRLKEVWGERIYGCTICQDCCPWNRKPVKGNIINLGVISPDPSLKFYLTVNRDDIKKKFKGTALGMSWVKPEHLIRNAIISCVSSEKTEIDGEINKFQDFDDPGIRDAARWAQKKSGKTGN